MVLLLLAALDAAFAGDAPVDRVCPDEPVAALVGAAQRVEAAWLGLDGPGFEVARGRLVGLTSCVDEPLTARDAAAVHRAQALVAYVGGDNAAATRSLAAVHALDPLWTPPDSVPAEHPLWRVYEAAAAQAGESRFVPFAAAPAHGWLLDGARFPREGAVSGLPAERAFLLQVFDAGQRVAYTGYHITAADVPVGELRLLGEGAESRRKRRRDARIWGSVVGGALLAGGAVAFGLGWQDRLSLAEVPVTDVLPTASRANTLGSVSYGLAGAGVLAFTLAWSVPW